MLRQVKQFDPKDEARLEDTHGFTSQFLHTDGSIPARIPSSALISPHFSDMEKLFDKYKSALGIK